MTSIALELNLLSCSLFFCLRCTHGDNRFYSGTVIIISLHLNSTGHRSWINRSGGMEVGDWRAEGSLDRMMRSMGVVLNL